MIKRTSEGALPATNERIKKFEADFGFKLPESYRAFLLAFNGGRPEPDCFVIRAGTEPIRMRVHFFYGLDEPDEAYDLEWNLKLLSDRISSGVLPIACDECGNAFCLDLRHAKEGVVRLFDHEEGSTDLNVAPQLVIAKSFAEWANSFEEERV